MILKYFHDFTDMPAYSYPFVLVYRGSLIEIIDVEHWCKDTLLESSWTSMTPILVDDGIFHMSFHFIKKQDAMFCKLSHE